MSMLLIFNELHRNIRSSVTYRIGTHAWREKMELKTLEMKWKAREDFLKILILQYFYKITMFILILPSKQQI